LGKIGTMGFGVIFTIVVIYLIFKNIGKTMDNLGSQFNSKEFYDTLQQTRRRSRQTRSTKNLVRGSNREISSEFEDWRSKEAKPNSKFKSIPVKKQKRKAKPAVRAKGPDRIEKKGQRKVEKKVQKKVPKKPVKPAVRRIDIEMPKPIVLPETPTPLEPYVDPFAKKPEPEVVEEFVVEEESFIDVNPLPEVAEETDSDIFEDNFDEEEKETLDSTSDKYWERMEKRLRKAEAKQEKEMSQMLEEGSDDSYGDFGI
jgi:hypothetical protein